MDNFGEVSTPKNKCRYLGLRRTIEKPNKHKTPLSDVKVNYKSLQRNLEFSPSPLIQCTTNNIEKSTLTSSSPATPRLPQNKLKSAHTINTFPGRLSLSSRAREKYRKKKLEFTVAKNEAELDTLADTCSKATTEEGTSNDLLQEIIESEKILTSHEKHLNKVKELKALIETWKAAFKTSLEELSSKINPKKDTEDLLACLGIPPEMIEYT